MFQYIAAIQQDVVDFGFLPARGAHAVVLIAIEEGRASWADLESVQSIRINYSSKSQAPAGHNVAGNSSNVKPRQGMASNSSSMGPARGGLICKNYNTGTCTHSNSHVSNDIQYNHHCSRCSAQGKKYSHRQTECRRNGGLESVPGND